MNTCTLVGLGRDSMTTLEGDNNLVSTKTGGGETLRDEAVADLFALQPKTLPGSMVNTPSSSLKPSDRIQVTAAQQLEVPPLPGVHDDPMLKQGREVYVAVAAASGQLQEAQNRTPLPAAQDQPSKPEDANRSVSYTVKSGDNLWKIAREHLERGADNAEIANYVNQIVGENHIHNPNLIHPGDVIKMSPYAPSAHHETMEHHTGYRHTRHHIHHQQRYEYRVEHQEHHESHVDTVQHKDEPPQDQTHDATVRPQPPVQGEPPAQDKPQPDNKPLEPHVPAKIEPPEKPESSTKPAEKPTEVDPLANPEVRLEHAKVVEMAKRHNNKSEHRQFIRDINQYEHSFSKLEESYRLKGKSPEEINKEIGSMVIGSYKGIERLYEKGEENPQERKRLDLAARTAVHNIAQAPVNGDIEQGQHQTCGANAVETKMAIEHSDKYMNMVADLAITGQHTAADGSVVKIDNAPHGDSTLSIPGQKVKRNYASELFQVAAINLDLQKKDSGLSWVQGNPNKYDLNPAHRAGEALLQDGKIISYQPGITASDIAQMYSLVSGEPLIPITFQHGKACDNGAICVGTFSEFEKVLQERKDNGDFWAIAEVDAASNLFKPPQLGGHAILLSDYYPDSTGDSAKVRYFNSWGIQTTNKVVYAQEMFNALLSPQH